MRERRCWMGVGASAVLFGAIVGCSSGASKANTAGGGGSRVTTTSASSGGSGATSASGPGATSASGPGATSSAGTCTTTSGAGTSSSGGGTGYSCEVKSPALHECTLYQGLSSSDLADQMMECAALNGTSGTSCPTAGAIGTCTADFGQETWYSDGATTVAEAQASCSMSIGTWSTAGSTMTGSSTSSCGAMGSSSAAGSTSAASSSGTSAGQVMCGAGGPCPSGQLCCYYEAFEQDLETCEAPGQCPSGYVELSCSSPANCPGAVCCLTYVQGGSYKVYTGASCAPTCSGADELIACTGDPTVCPTGTTCTMSTLIPGYSICE